MSLPNELDGLDAVGLRAFAAAHNIKVTNLPTVKAETLRRQIDEALAANEAESASNEPQAVPEGQEPAVVNESAQDAPEPDDEAPAPAFLDDGLIRYAHPDNGSMGGFDTDEDGNVLALGSDAALLASHGFFPVPDKEI